MTPNLIYTITFYLSLLMLIALVGLYKNKVSVHYVLLYSAITILNYGYKELAEATDLRSAMAANRTVYLGAAFCPFLVLVCFTELCRVKIDKIARILLLAYSFIIWVISCFAPTGSLYYKEAYFYFDENGLGRLIKVDGPLHVLFPAYLIIVIAICIYGIIRAIVKKSETSYATCMVLMGCIMMVIGTYIYDSVASPALETLPIGYVIALLTLLTLLIKICNYDVYMVSLASLNSELTFGFLICDSKKRYLGSNEVAKEWFPEIKGVRVDHVFDSNTTDFLDCVRRWLISDTIDESVYFERGGKTIEARHSTVDMSNKTMHVIYLRDDTKQREYTKLVENYNANLEKNVKIKTDKLKRVQSDIVISMASIVENRDSSTGGHIARTSDVVEIFVNYLLRTNICPTLTEEVAENIIKAAPLHDFGKIAISDDVLNKKGKFTEAEYEEMKKHSEKGSVIVARILENSDDAMFRKIAVNVAHFHHEKWNGKGYPTGKSGEDIPFEARVMALADVFDALVSKRVYKEKYSYDKAFGIIEEEIGEQFDPVLGREFLNCRCELEKLYSSYPED